MSQCLHGCRLELDCCDHQGHPYALQKASIQRLLCEQAADLTVNILKAIGNTRLAMAQAFLDLAALVLQHGEVDRILYRLGDWARTADPSLIRHFIFKVLEACAPPYSAYFASSLITYDLAVTLFSSCARCMPLGIIMHEPCAMTFHIIPNGA